MIPDRWRKFLIGLCCFTMIFWILPILYGHIPGSDSLRQVIEREGIDVTALFYSGESRSAGSRRWIEEKLKFEH